MIGDSTSAIHSANVYPMMGWAQAMREYLNQSVSNHSVSGSSSASFYTNQWPAVLAALEPGDYLLIQFGHNDVDGDATFKANMQRFVDEARESNVWPILLTPIERNSWSAGMLQETHGGYPDAVRELATEIDVPLIDHTELTHDYFTSLGEAATTDTIFMNLAPGVWPNYPSGNSDNTHLQATGARAVLELALDDAGAQGLEFARVIA